ncbi:hypothetical protein LGQ03_15465 [Loktanella sp. TSTF-M6]|uniref:Pilus assembly protein CpaE n=1 Tax=Loktanella gaetbuli TaxID=2881335 RepID=A0ABS8BY19_9RHOB|nr:hypothetical protein [Loktanella gaetbuli]MCB5200637.1 hypothetical protein [Loktanella gaetbuli]
MTRPPSDTTPLAAYVCTDEGADVARTAVERSGGDDSALRGGGLSGAARLCSGAPIAQTLLTEMGNIPVDMACDCVTELRATGAEVIVLGRADDIGTYRALRQAGALEYFAFPVTADEILAIQRRPPANDVTAPASRRPCIAVTGSNGGVGASLLARNLAVHAANPRGANMRTALIDADLRFGAQALDLDQDHTPGFIDALRSPDRVDATFLSATMATLGPQLSLYSHHIRLTQDVAMLEEGLPGLISVLQSEFAATVLDMPRGTLLRDSALLQALDTLVMVVPGGYGGVNAAARMIQTLREDAPDLRILPVLSDLRRDAGLTARDMGRSIGLDIAATLPRCDKAVLQAHRTAGTLIDAAPRSPYARAVRDLWSMIGPAPAQEPSARASLLKRMFG